MSDCKRLLSLAKAKCDDIITNDDEYYLSVGLSMALMVRSMSSQGVVYDRIINNIINAKSDEMLKKRLTNVFKKVKQVYFSNTWQGALLSNVMIYKPKEDVVHCENAHNNIIIGFNSPLI